MNARADDPPTLLDDDTRPGDAPSLDAIGERLSRRITDAVRSARPGTRRAARVRE
jgi:hypothetical protein